MDSSLSAKLRTLPSSPKSASFSCDTAPTTSRASAMRSGSGISRRPKLSWPPGRPWTAVTPNRDPSSWEECSTATQRLSPGYSSPEPTADGCSARENLISPRSCRWPSPASVKSAQQGLVLSPLSAAFLADFPQGFALLKDRGLKSSDREMHAAKNGLKVIPHWVAQLC